MAHRFTWLFGLQILTELKACSSLAIYHCGTDGQTDGETDGQTNGRTDRRTTGLRELDILKGRAKPPPNILINHFSTLILATSQDTKESGGLGFKGNSEAVSSKTTLVCDVWNVLYCTITCVRLFQYQGKNIHNNLFTPAGIGQNNNIKSLV